MRSNEHLEQPGFVFFSSRELEAICSNAKAAQYQRILSSRNKPLAKG